MCGVLLSGISRRSLPDTSTSVYFVHLFKTQFAYNMYYTNDDRAFFTELNKKHLATDSNQNKSTAIHSDEKSRFINTDSSEKGIKLTQPSVFNNNL